MPRPITPDHLNYDSANDGCGVLARNCMGDPRINKKQMEAIEAACKADREALVMGIDENQRVVVRARVGVPRMSKSWAVMRNGDPANPGRIFDPFVSTTQR